MNILFSYKGARYPEYLRHGNAQQFAAPFAAHFCKGHGVDVGCGKWPFPGAVAVDNTLREGEHGALNLPGKDGEYDYVFSSHCLEHLINPVHVLEHWMSKLKVGGCMFLYLPHPDMKYWRPHNCRKHLHVFYPRDVGDMLRDLGFHDVVHSERDFAWSFAVAGYKS